MRKALGIGIGVTLLASLAWGGISVASAAAPANDGWSAVPATPSTRATVAGVNVVEARRLAEAAVPGGHVVQIESGDQADHPIWKLTVDRPAGRIIMMVDVASGVVTPAHQGLLPWPHRRLNP
jgi:hypothetical protein